MNGRTRWRLLDGFRQVPALAFAPTELMALLFGRDLLKPLDGTHIRASLDSALAKVSRAAPGLDFVRAMPSSVSVRLGPEDQGVWRRGSVAPRSARRRGLKAG
jgi:hypothetical protein